MDNRIVLQKNNNKIYFSDLEWIEEFHLFLQGVIPEGIKCTPLNLTAEQSNTIIWYLQEHLSVFPDNIEMCDNCNCMYDTYSEGCYYEIESKNFCGRCEHLSEAAYCNECGIDVWKEDAITDGWYYLCKDCKKNKQ